MNGRDYPIGVASGIEFYSEDEENEYANQLIAEAIAEQEEEVLFSVFN